MKKKTEKKELKNKTTKAKNGQRCAYLNCVWFLTRQGWTWDIGHFLSEKKKTEKKKESIQPATIKPYRSEARKAVSVAFTKEQKEEIERILAFDPSRLDFDFYKDLEWEVKQLNMDRVLQEGDDISGPRPKPHQTRDQLKEFHKAANKFINCLNDLDDVTLLEIQDCDREWSENLMMQLRHRASLAERAFIKPKGKREAEDEALNAFIFRLAVLYFRATGKEAKRTSRGNSKKENRFCLFVEYIINELNHTALRKKDWRYNPFRTRKLSRVALEELIRNQLKDETYKEVIIKLRKK